MSEVSHNFRCPTINRNLYSVNHLAMNPTICPKSELGESTQPRPTLRKHEKLLKSSSSLLEYPYRQQIGRGHVVP